MKTQMLLLLFSLFLPVKLVAAGREVSPSAAISVGKGNGSSLTIGIDLGARFSLNESKRRERGKRSYGALAPRFVYRHCGYPNNDNSYSTIVGGGLDYFRFSRRIGVGWFIGGDLKYWLEKEESGAELSGGLKFLYIEIETYYTHFPSNRDVGAALKFDVGHLAYWLIRS